MHKEDQTSGSSGVKSVMDKSLNLRDFPVSGYFLDYCEAPLNIYNCKYLYFFMQISILENCLDSGTSFYQEMMTKVENLGLPSLDSVQIATKLE